MQNGSKNLYDIFVITFATTVCFSPKNGWYFLVQKELWKLIDYLITHHVLILNNEVGYLRGRNFQDWLDHKIYLD